MTDFLAPNVLLYNDFPQTFSLQVQELRKAALLKLERRVSFSGCLSTWMSQEVPESVGYNPNILHL